MPPPHGGHFKDLQGLRFIGGVGPLADVWHLKGHYRAMGNAELGGNLCHSWGQFLKNPSNTSTPPPSTLHPSHQVITCQPVPDPRVFPPGVSQHLRRGPSTHDPAPETVRGARAGRVVSRVGQGAHLDLLRPDEVHLIRVVQQFKARAAFT